MVGMRQLQDDLRKSILALAAFALAMLALATPARIHDAHIVDTELAADRSGLLAEPVAYLLIRLCQRQPADSALLRRADRSGCHKRVP